MTDYDLIHYPFIVNKKEEVNLSKVNPEGFKMKFVNDVFSKSVRSTLNSGTKKYIEIEIDDKNECKIISETNEIHEFITPADFYVGTSEKTREFYLESYKNITNENIEYLDDYAVKFGEFSNNSILPEYPVPLTTTTLHFENFESSHTKVYDNKANYYSIQIKIGDEIPKKISVEIESNIRKDMNDYKYKLQKEILTEFFKGKKIVKAKDIEELYNNKLDKSIRQEISYTILKRAVGLHAYYYTNGPWRHSWVLIGYDPSLFRENYKYQTLYYKETHVPFRLIEYEEIINEIEKNPNWFLLKRFDLTKGFISQALYDLISYMIYK